MNDKEREARAQHFRRLKFAERRADAKKIAFSPAVTAALTSLRAALKFDNGVRNTSNDALIAAQQIGRELHSIFDPTQKEFNRRWNQSLLDRGLKEAPDVADEKPKVVREKNPFWKSAEGLTKIAAAQADRAVVVAKRVERHRRGHINRRRSLR